VRVRNSDKIIIIQGIGLNVPVVSLTTWDGMERHEQDMIR
jgi:hypothetical protein